MSSWPRGSSAMGRWCASTAGGPRRCPPGGEAAELFAAVARARSAAPPGDPRRRWRLPAAFQAWRIAHSSQGIQLPDLEDLQAILTADPDPGDDPGDEALVPALTRG